MCFTTNFIIPEILNPRQRRDAPEMLQNMFFQKIAEGFLSSIGSELFVLVKDSGVGIARSWSRMSENEE